MFTALLQNQIHQNPVIIMNNTIIKPILIGLLSGAFIFCLLFCFIGLNPIVSSEYILTCIEGEEQRHLLINLSKMEGMVFTLQRMIPIYGSLIIAVILFLTWSQAGIAKSTAIHEINDNFKSYKDRIEELLDQANDLTQKIQIKHEGICNLAENPISLEDLIHTIKNKANEGKIN